MLQDLSLLTNSAQLDLWLLLLNLFVGVVLSLVLRFHFQRFGSTLSNREEFAQVFPFVLLTTVLIITIVKSSLALSLGLVGALSIVRFRTPIKEPEELAYLFIAIAMGLGLGAGQTTPTVIGGLFILIAMATLNCIRSDANKGKNIYLSIEWDTRKDGQSDQHLERLTNVLSNHSASVDLRRFDVHGDNLEATFFLDITNIRHLSAITDELRREFPSVDFTFLDQNQLPSI